MLDSQMLKLLHSPANLKEEMTQQDVKPLSILILLNRVPFPQNDGGAIAMFSAVTGYAQAGCQLRILSMNTSKHFVEEEKAKSVFTEYGLIDLVWIDNRIKPFAALVNLFSSASYILQRFYSNHFENSLIEMLKNNKFDIVHVDTLSCMLYSNVVRKHSEAKLVYRAHNIEHQIWERSAEYETNVFKKWYLTVQAKRLKKFELEEVKKADTILAISKQDELAFKQITRKDVLYVPTGMSVPAIQSSYTKAENLFFIGSFDWLPNLQGMDWFLGNVWDALRVKFPALKFYVAGKQMPERILKLKTEQFVPIEKVDDAKQFMALNGLMIVPLVSGSGVRIKIIEALALGKTIIATTIAAEGLGLTNGKNILIANNANEFIEKIDRCINEPHYAEEIGRNAHSFALEKFQNQKIFTQLISYYRQQI